MDFSTAHSDVVIFGYALTSLCLLGLVAVLVLRDRKLAKKLKDLDVD